MLRKFITCMAVFGITFIATSLVQSCVSMGPVVTDENITRQYKALATEFENVVKGVCPTFKLAKHKLVIVEKWSDRTIGMCTYSVLGMPYTITLSRQYWSVADIYDRFQLVAHELTHCSYNMGHTDDPNHYMAPELRSLQPYLMEEQIQEIAISECEISDIF